MAGVRGVLPSGAFPEPASPSYGAPGVEFMGLHRENNAVVQIHFLPGQVSPPRPMRFLESHAEGSHLAALGSVLMGAPGTNLPFPVAVTPVCKGHVNTVRPWLPSEHAPTPFPP